MVVPLSVVAVLRNTTAEKDKDREEVIERKKERPELAKFAYYFAPLALLQETPSLIEQETGYAYVHIHICVLVCADFCLGPDVMM